MSGTYFTLNQKYNNLRTQDNGGGGGGGGGGGIYTAIGMVNITQYGASTALPDNTTFIQNAINAVAVGGTLYIPQGTFIILGSLTISTSINIFGVGTIKAGGAMPYMLGLNASVDMFGGLTIDGNSLAVIGLRLLNTIGVRLNNVEIKSCTTGISSSALSSINLTIVDCLITNMTGTGISYQSPVVASPTVPPTLDVNNTIFRDCNKGISDILSSNIIVQGCIFDNIVFSISTGSFSATTNPFSYSITNNQFTRITGSAILINLVNTANANTTTISNNIFSSRVSSYTPINTIGGTFSTFNYDSPVLGIFGISSFNTQFIQNTIEDMHIPETTSAIIMRCTLLTASFNNIGLQSVITGTPGLFIKCLDTAPFQQPILFLDRNVFKTQRYMELVGFPAIPIPPIPGGFVVPTLTSSPCASFFDIDTYSSGVDYVIDNTYETYAFTETFANTIKLIVNQSPTRIQFTNTSTAIGSAVYPTKIVDLLFNADTPLNSFVACDGVSFPNSIQMRFGKSGTYEIVYNPTTDTLTSTRLEDVGISTFNAVISTASIDLTSPTFYNSIVNFTGTTASTIDLPDPITNTRNNIYLGTSIQIFNNTSQQQIIQTPVNILGVYGSNATTIPLPENSWYKLVVDGSNWRINERSSNLTYQLSLSVNTDYSTYDYLVNATTRFAPTTALTATIPSPVSASGGSSGHTTMNIINNSDHVLTLLTTGIDFRGKYGRSNSGVGTNNTIPLPPHSTMVLYSNGVHWVANERSYNPTYFITLSSASTDASTFNYFSDATVNISSTAVTNNILVIPPPNRNEIDNATITFSNTSVYSITLSITAGTFAGKYGSGTTTLIVPANCWVQLLTDGTNWVVDNRSAVFNLFLYSGTTAFDWSTDYQYLDNQVELVPADDALNTSATITGSGTMAGYVFTFTALSGTGLGAGSIFSVDTSPTRKYIILCQVGGTLGGIGDYLCNFAGTYASTVTITMRPNLTTNSNGNLTQGALTTQTGIYSTATFTTGTPFAGMTVGIPTATVMGNNPFYVIRQNSGTSWFVSSNSTGTLGATNWFGNRGNTITLPNPSNATGRTFTLINNSGTMTNITSAGGTALFGGRYGQMILNTATVASNYPVGAFPTNYLLRPNQTVVLKSDGTQWETQEGTSLGEQRAYCNSITFSTSASDGTVSANYPLYNYDQTFSNLSGLINITNGTSPAWCNLYPFPITLQMTFSFTWAGIAVSGPVLPSRNIILTCFGAGTTGFTGTSINTLTIPCSVASPNFTTIIGDNIQYYTSTITLRSFEVFTVQLSKRDGSGTARTTGFSTMFIKRLA
jgi:hypothetical protein